MKRQVLRLATLVTVIGILTILLRIHDFLAINRPVDGNVLVVEAWVWDSPAMTEAKDVFLRGHYRWLVTVGGPADDGSSTAKSMATLAAERLKGLGVAADSIVELPMPDTSAHYTYHSALTVRNWLAKSHAAVTGVDVFTLGTHARKSLELFKRALGPQIPVGVLAGTDDSFEASRWWLSMRGIYVIGRKTLGYLYAIVWPLPHEAVPL